MTWEHLSNQKGDKRNSPLNTWRKMRIGWGVPKLTVLTINWEQQPTRGWMRWVERVGEVARDVEREGEWDWVEERGRESLRVEKAREKKWGEEKSEWRSWERESKKKLRVRKSKEKKWNQM